MMIKMPITTTISYLFQSTLLSLSLLLLISSLSSIWAHDFSSSLNGRLHAPRSSPNQFADSNLPPFIGAQTTLVPSGYAPSARLATLEAAITSHDNNQLITVEALQQFVKQSPEFGPYLAQRIASINSNSNQINYSSTNNNNNSHPINDQTNQQKIIRSDHQVNQSSGELKWPPMSGRPLDADALDIVHVPDRFVNLPSHSGPSNHHQQQQRQETDSRLRAKWTSMERSFGESLANLAAYLKPILINTMAQSNGTISTACKTTLLELLRDAKDERTTAAQMMDASARLPSGMLDGTLTELGNFNECLNIKNHKMGVRGSYCTLQVKPQLPARPPLHTICQRVPGMANVSSSATNRIVRRFVEHSHEFYYVGLRLGVCVPSKCNKHDIQSILSSYLSQYELVGEVKSCQLMNEVNYDNYEISIMSAFAFIVALAVVGTLYDLHSDRKSRHNQWLIYQAATIKHRANLHPPNSIVNSGQTGGSDSNSRTGDLELDSGSVSSRSQTVSSSDDGSNSEVSLNGLPMADSGRSSKEVLMNHQHHHQDHDVIINATTREMLSRNDPRALGRLTGKQGGMANSDCNSSTKSSPSTDSDTEHLARIIRVLPTSGLETTMTSAPPSLLSSSIIKAAPGRPDTEDIQIIHGLRVLTMTWIIFGHSIGLVNPEMMSNLFTLSQLSCTSLALQALLNATLAVNTFFMISGLVTAISFARKCLPSHQHHQHCHAKPNNLLLVKEPLLKSSSSETCATVGQQETAEPDDGHHHHHDHHQVIKVTKDGKKPRERKLSDESHGSLNRNLISSTATALGPAIASASSSLSSSTGTANNRLDYTTTRRLFSPMTWIMMRYLRLTPTYAIIIGLSILLPRMGSGPFWQETIHSLSMNCRDGWWKNLLYINNFVDTDKLCLIHSWYLSNDFQFHFIAVLLILIFLRSRKAALLTLIFLMLLSSLATGWISWLNKFPPTIVTTSPAVAERWTFIHSLYYKPWPHLPSYLIGLLVGFAIVKKKSIHLSGARRFLGWFISLSMGAAILNSIYPWNMGLYVEPWLGGLHSALFRTLWSACCAWIVFVSSIRTNMLSNILSWEGFQLPSRLTFSAYLVHPLVIYYHFGSLTERLDSSMFAQFHRFMSNWIITYLLSFILTLFIESPSIKLQQLLMERLGAHNKSSTPINNNLHRQWMAPDESSTMANGKPNQQHHQTNTSEFESIVDSAINVVSSKHHHHQQNHHATDTMLNIEFTGLDEPIDKRKSSRKKAAKSTLGQCNGKHLPDSIALDTEFQQKLSQAISKGFKIRSQQVEQKRGHAHSKNDTKPMRPIDKMSTPDATVDAILTSEGNFIISQRNDQRHLANQLASPASHSLPAAAANQRGGGTNELNGGDQSGLLGPLSKCPKEKRHHTKDRNRHSANPNLCYNTDGLNIILAKSIMAIDATTDKNNARPTIARMSDQTHHQHPHQYQQGYYKSNPQIPLVFSDGQTMMNIAPTMTDNMHQLAKPNRRNLSYQNSRQQLLMDSPSQHSYPNGIPIIRPAVDDLASFQDYSRRQQYQPKTYE